MAKVHKHLFPFTVIMITISVLTTITADLFCEELGGRIVVGYVTTFCVQHQTVLVIRLVVGIVTIACILLATYFLMAPAFHKRLTDKEPDNMVK